MSSLARRNPPVPADNGIGAGSRCTTGGLNHWVLLTGYSQADHANSYVTVRPGQTCAGLTLLLLHIHGPAGLPSSWVAG